MLTASLQPESIHVDPITLPATPPPPTPTEGNHMISILRNLPLPNCRVTQYSLQPTRRRQSLQKLRQTTLK